MTVYVILQNDMILMVTNSATITRQKLIELREKDKIENRNNHFWFSAHELVEE